MQGITRIIETELKLCTVYPDIICLYLHSPLVTRYSCQFHWKPTHIVKIRNYNHRIWLSSFWKTAFCFPTHEAKCIYIYIYIYIYTHTHTYIVYVLILYHIWSNIFTMSTKEFQKKTIRHFLMEPSPTSLDDNVPNCCCKLRQIKNDALKSWCS